MSMTSERDVRNSETTNAKPNLETMFITAEGKWECVVGQ